MGLSAVCLWGQMARLRYDGSSQNDKHAGGPCAGMRGMWHSHFAVVVIALLTIAGAPIAHAQTSIPAGESGIQSGQDAAGGSSLRGGLGVGNDGSVQTGTDQLADTGGAQVVSPFLRSRTGFGAIAPGPGGTRSGLASGSGTSGQRPSANGDLLDDLGSSAGSESGNDEAGGENITPPAPLDGLVVVNDPQQPQDGDLAALEASPVPQPTTDGMGAAFTREGAIRRLDPNVGLSVLGHERNSPLSVLNRVRRESQTLEVPESLATDQSVLDGRDAANAGQSVDQPYAALGIRSGSFIIRPEVIADVRFTDNVTSSAGPRHADQAFELRPSVIVQSDWQNHAVELDIQSLATFHREFSSEDDRAIAVTGRSRIDLRHNFTLNGEISYEFEQEARNSIEVAGTNQSGDRNDVETVTTSLGLDKRFNRLDVALRATAIRFDDAAVDRSVTNLANPGTVVTLRDDRDYKEHVGEARIGARLKPGFEVFTRGEVRHRDYSLQTFADGNTRDAATYQGEVGVAGDISRGILTGSAAVGYASIDPEADRLGGADGLIYNASLMWLPTALTTVRLAAAGDVEPTTLSGSGGLHTQAYSGEVEHRFRRHFQMTAGVAYGRQDYAGVYLTEEEIESFVSAEYLFSRNWAAVARYEYTHFDSTDQGRDYEENSFRVGVRARR